MTSIGALQRRAHRTSFDHGFWTASASIPTKLMLIVTEIAEAMEEFRDKKDYLNLVRYTGDKPEGFPTELADAVIRIMDLAEYLNINLGAVIEEKMDYNDNRPYLHGGKTV